jgi:hypothetical protein
MKAMRSRESAFTRSRIMILWSYMFLELVVSSMKVLKDDASLFGHLFSFIKCKRQGFKQSRLDRPIDYLWFSNDSRTSDDQSLIISIIVMKILSAFQLLNSLILSGSQLLISEYPINI